MRIEDLLKRYTRAMRQRELMRSLYEPVYRFVLPDRDVWTTQTIGEDRQLDIYDSTASIAATDFASRVQANICPPWRRWSKLSGGPGLPEELRESDDLTLALEKQTDILFTYLNHSNFSGKCHESLLELSAGTGALTLEMNERGDGLEFGAIPTAYLGIEEGPGGAIETVYTDHKIAVGHLERKYPGIELSPDMLSAREKDPTAEVEYRCGDVYDPRTARYTLYVFDKSRIMYERDLGETKRTIVFRYTVAPGEVFGRGPGVWALPDVRTLNKTIEMILQGAALSMFPPFTAVSDGMINPYNVVIQPNTVIPVSSNDNSNPSLRQLLNSPRPDLAQFILEDMRRTVRQHFLADTRRREGPIQSATEVMIEDRDFVERSGSAHGRLQSELIAPIVRRCVDLLARAGKMAPIRVDGQEVTLEHTSPLARQQDQADLMAFSQGMQLAGVLGPEAVNIGLKMEDVPEWIFKKAGAPAELLRTDIERQEKIQQMAQVAAQMQQ